MEKVEAALDSRLISNWWIEVIFVLWLNNIHICWHCEICIFVTSFHFQAAVPELRRAGLTDRDILKVMSAKKILNVLKKYWSFEYILKKFCWRWWTPKKCGNGRRGAGWPGWQACFLKLGIIQTHIEANHPVKNKNKTYSQPGPQY